MIISPPDGYRHHYPIQIRWADLDALGHVNNATYLTYCEQARLTYINELGLWGGTLDGLGLIMARAVIDYKLPLGAADDLHVFTRCSRLGNKSFDMEHLVARRSDDQLAVAAQAVITVVVFDYAANRSAPLPPAWRDRLIAYEPAAIQT